jgi:hypothetical protein
MDGLEKIKAAFSPEGSAEFAAVICYEGIYIRDHWRQLTHFPWWYPFSPNLDHAFAWRSQVLPAIGQDWFELPACRSRSYRETHTIVERDGRVFLEDTVLGQHSELFEPSVGGWELLQHGYSGHVDQIVQNESELDALIPRPAPIDRQAFQSEGYADLANQLLSNFGAVLYPTASISTPLWSCYWLWGFEGMMEMIARKPALVRYACDRFLQQQIESVHQAAALGAQGIWIEDCLTDMIHPRDFARLHLPDLHALVDEIRACGMDSIHYFCGNPAGKLEMILSSGVDALALEESKKGFEIDIARVAEAVNGRCALLGNLDAISLLSQASEADLQAELKRQAAAGRRNHSRFVFSTGSPVTPATSPQRVRLYCDLAHEIGVR